VDESTLLVALLIMFRWLAADPIIQDFIVFVVALWGLAKTYAACRDRRGHVRALILVAIVWYLTGMTWV